MSDTMTVTQARAALPRLLDRVQRGEEITVTRHGVPVAVLIRPDSLRVRRGDSALATIEGVRNLLAEGRSRSLHNPGTVHASRAEELIRDIRESRSRA
ncbi:MAG TPA: type II toxin-antitoxin system prevent-host-death family antitoxin [Acidimicrobiia bacterium]|nr:type II toxin-antitoxin system prevent-host-death family antitoxin [Acidimicrobiia bacterium]